MAPLAQVPWGMVAYLVILSSMSLSVLLLNERVLYRDYRWVIFSLMLLFVIFFLAWGGYSKDSWRYVNGFIGSPLVYEKEHLFYIIGYFLDKAFVAPWPLKIYAAGCAGLVCLSIAKFHGMDKPRHVIFGMLILALTPACFLIMGNALRQAYAAVIIVFGMMYFVQGRYFIFLFSGIVAFSFHQTSVILFAAVALANLRIPLGWTCLGLAVAPFVSFLVVFVDRILGLGIVGGVWLYFLDKTEGVFYLEKFALAYSVAWFFLLSNPDPSDDKQRVLWVYVYMVMMSCLLLRFQVPFERMLAYSELLWPLCLPVIASSYKRVLNYRVVRLGGSVFLLVMGLLLWTHGSILSSFGYL